MIYKSNFQSVIKDLEKKLGKVQDDTKIIREIATTTQAEIMRRVFNKGKSTNYSPIGQYSTKTTLVGRSSFVKKTTWDAVYKNKRYKWVTFKKRRLKVLPGGYKMIRQLEGKRTDTVNEQRTGKLKSSFLIEGRGSSYVIGFDNYGSKISEYQEKHFGKLIWNPTGYEKGLITKMINTWVALQLK